MIVDFMGRISSVEFMARLDDYYENIRPYFHFPTFTEKKYVGTIYDKLCMRQCKSDILHME